MSTTEDFEDYLAWQEALLRVREPELCEAVAALDAEYGLFGHRDPRRGVEAVKDALATERGRNTIADFGHELIMAQNEIARELSGEPDQTLPTKSPPRYSILEDTPPEQTETEQADEGEPRERMQASKAEEKRRVPFAPISTRCASPTASTPLSGLRRSGGSEWRGRDLSLREWGQAESDRPEGSR